jgi:pimeloyl-ACP methyl ester carboxylesterase
VGRLVLRALGALLLLVLLLIAVGPFFMAPGARLAIVGSPADVGLRYESVSFPPDDRAITLRAWWMPAETAKAAIILVHGGGDDNRAQPHSDGLHLMRDLVGHGYSVLALDLRNYGESDGTRDGITFGELEASDVVGAIDYLARRQRGLRFGALGMSMGGETVLYAAAEDARLEAVVTDGTFAEARTIAANFAHAASGLPAAILPPFLWSAEHLHGIPLGRGRAIDLGPRLASRRVLLIHNAGDPIVPVDDCRRLATAIPGAETWISPAPPREHPLWAEQGPWGMHTQSYKLAPAEYVERVSRFFDAVFR